MLRTISLWLVFVLFSSATSAVGAAERRDANDFGLFLEGEEQLIPLPLASTQVRGTLRGFVARVEATQVFVNPYDAPIDATYVFPLPEAAAVHEMVMKVGEREIVAQIERREEAMRVYEEAVARGHAAALLTQERPNIFTQRVGNLLPGHAIEVRLSYVEALPYESGRSTFAFPMVVGPRFIPGQPLTRSNLEPNARADDTAIVPDASRITPPVLAANETSAHRIDLSLNVQTGRPIRALSSPSHEIEVVEREVGSATVQIAPTDTFPNKDFILRIDVRGDEPEMTLLSHREGDEEGYLTLAIQPPLAPEPSTLTPKDLFFVVDNSGSMHGKPIEAAKLLVKEALANMNPDDRFTIMRFSDAVSELSAVPLVNTPENVEAGIRFIEGMYGSGGTQMLSGVLRAISGETAPGRIRIVFFLTDGYIGNDAQILDAIKNQNTAEARLFSLGVGSSVNRYLLSGMARLGRGEMQVMRHDEDPAPFVERFYARVRDPVLTDVEIDWGGLEVFDTLPEQVPDLFANQPLLTFGRFAHGGNGVVTVRGRMGGRKLERSVRVTLPEHAKRPAIASLWARERIQVLSDKETSCPGCFKEEITEVALEHRLMSQYTAFVAVDHERVVRSPIEPLIPIAQRLPLPEGVSRWALGELSRRHIPPGDPIISVAAPPDARRVTAYFPFGLVKELHYDAIRDLWRGRFLVPAGIPDGVYDILVVIELVDGTLMRRREQYNLDSRASDFIASFTDGWSEPGAMVELNVDAVEPASEVYLHCPELGWHRVAMTAIDDEQVRWDKLLVLDEDTAPGSYSVLVVVRDAAGNRHESRLTLTVCGGEAY